MALTHRRTKRGTHRATRRTTRTISDTRQVIERIDAMVRELAAMRRQLTPMPKPASALGITQELFGAAGKGTRDEYDMNLDWVRFSEWQLR